MGTVSLLYDHALQHKGRRIPVPTDRRPRHLLPPPTLGPSRPLQSPPGPYRQPPPGAAQHRPGLILLPYLRPHTYKSHTITFIRAYVRQYICGHLHSHASPNYPVLLRPDPHTLLYSPSGFDFFLKEKKKTRVPRCASFALQVSIPTTATSYRNGRCHNGSQALHNGNC